MGLRTYQHFLRENHAKSIITLFGQSEELVQVKECGTYRTSVLRRVKYSSEINGILLPLEVPIDQRAKRCPRLFQEFSDVFITARFISA